MGEEVIECAIGGERLFVTEYGQASSILEPQQHAVSKVIEVKSCALRDIESGFDMLVMDIQGAELIALKTSDLPYNYIIVELSNKPRYVGACTKNRVVKYLADYTYAPIASYQHAPHDIYDVVFKKGERV